MSDFVHSNLYTQRRKLYIGSYLLEILIPVILEEIFLYQLFVTFEK